MDRSSTKSPERGSRASDLVPSLDFLLFPFNVLVVDRAHLHRLSFFEACPRLLAERSRVPRGRSRSFSILAVDMVDRRHTRVRSSTPVRASRPTNYLLHGTPWFLFALSGGFWYPGYSLCQRAAEPPRFQGLDSWYGAARELTGDMSFRGVCSHPLAPCWSCCDGAPDACSAVCLVELSQN
jgi:hypothetical protein